MAEGVWGHIVSLVPRPEVPEIESLVGSSLIEANQSLWRELKAFNSILSELHTLEFDEPLYNDKQQKETSRTDASSSSSTKNLPLLSLSNLEEFNKGKPAAADSHNIPANQEQQDPALTRRSNFSGDSMDFIFAIEEHLCIEKIQPVLEDIRRALRSEQSELEAEIALLMSAMDGESDSVTAKQVAAASLLSSSLATAPSERRAPLGEEEAKWVEATCPSCERAHSYSTSVKVHPGRIRKATAAASQHGQLCFSCLEVAMQPRKSAAPGTSRFRCKLQAARDEHHFLPDDLVPGHG